MIPRGRRRWAAAAAVLAVAAAAAIVVLSLGSDTSSSATKRSVPTTTRITRQDLVETDTESGTLGYADTRTVVDHLSGVITWIPQTGAVIHQGHTLYKVDGESVYLLDGSVPAYRAFTPGMSSGGDVRELEHSLRELGYDDGGAMKVDGTWDAGTTAAVERFQAAKGLAQTGSIELGRVVFQPGRRRIAGVSATPGTSGGSGSGAAASAAGSSASPASAPASSAGATRPALHVTGRDGAAVARAASIVAPRDASAPTATTPPSATTTTPAPATTAPAAPTTTPAPAPRPRPRRSARPRRRRRSRDPARRDGPAASAAARARRAAARRAREEAGAPGRVGRALARPRRRRRAVPAPEAAREGGRPGRPPPRRS